MGEHVLRRLDEQPRHERLDEQLRHVRLDEQVSSRTTRTVWFSGWGDSCGSARHGHHTMP